MSTDIHRKIKINCAVICDDIRRENNGKDILIGAYSSMIVVHALPTLALPLKCWISLEFRGPNVIKTTFKATDHNKQKIFEQTTNMGTDEKLGSGSFFFGPIFFSLREPKGHLDIDFKEEDDEWRRIITKEIIYRSR